MDAPHLAPGRREGEGDRLRPPRPRARRRGSRLDPLRDPNGLDPRRPRDPRRGRGDDDDLPVEHDGRLPLHPPGLGYADPPRREPRAGRPDRREALRGPRRDRRLRRGRLGRRVRPHPGRPDGERARLGCRQPGTVREDRRRREDRFPRDAHLHLGDHRPPEGRRADARLLALRGGRDRRAQAPQRGRPAVLLAPARPLVREGPRGGPAPDRLLDRDRRPRREDHRRTSGR